MDATMPDRGVPLSLWGIWWNAILLLRPAFSRLRTFMWFVTAVAGLTVRVELLGVTSIVRALNLRPSLYTKLLDHFHSSGIELDRLSALWARAVLGLFPSPVRINGRLVLVGDGIKAPKRGKKIPAVKLLHQQSESNTKPEYIMGHSMQAVGLLVHAAKSVFSVPLAVRIHEGLVWSHRDQRTLLDKMLGLLDILAIKAPFYFVADAYYAAGKMANGLLEQGNHLVTRVKSNAVAYAPAPRKKGRKTRGRPKTYGKKIKLKSLLANVKSMQQVASPVYGEGNVTLRYRVCDLLWRPAGRLVRFVVVMHPTRGSCILMCTDTSLSAVDIIRLYGLRFKIECSFKQAVRQIGTFAYHFWMKDMIPLRYHNGNQYLHRKSADYRARVKRKMRAYHAFIQAGVVAQGVSQSRLGLVRILVANHSSRHSAIGVRRCKSAAPGTSRISHGSRKNRFSHEIHRRSPRHAKYADFPLGIVNKKKDS